MAMITEETLKSIGMEDFTEEEEKVWKDWVNIVYDCHPNSLKEIIFGENYKTKFKQRALAVMLVPDYNKLPFYWHDDKDGLVHNFHVSSLIIEHISVNLFQFVLDLILECLEKLDYSYNFDKIEKEKIMNSWEYYQGLLVDFFEIITDESKKEFLFSDYFLNEAPPYDNIEFWRKCDPFLNLMQRKGIDEKWKKYADERMRSIVLSETKKQMGFSSGHYCSPLKGYADIIEINLAELCYSRKLFASQIEFIFNNINMVTPIEYPNIIKNEDIPKIMIIFSGNKYKLLRYKLCCYMLSKNEEDLKIYCKEGLYAAQIMFQQFPYLDKDLKNKLVRIINEGENYVLAEEENKRKNQKIKEKIISKMKN